MLPSPLTEKVTFPLSSLPLTVIVIESPLFAVDFDAFTVNDAALDIVIFIIIKAINVINNVKILYFLIAFLLFTHYIVLN